MTLAPTETDSGTIQSELFAKQETNLSGGGTDQGARQSQNVLEVAFSIIASCAFVFNLAFCVVLLKKRAMLKKPHNSLLFNLAVTDLLTGTVCFDLNALFVIPKDGMADLYISLEIYLCHVLN